MMMSSIVPMRSSRWFSTSLLISTLALVPGVSAPERRVNRLSTFVMPGAVQAIRSASSLP
jgi:hypothetical protein